MTAQQNWDGHTFDPAGQLSFPERIVHAVEAAIEGTGDITPCPLGDKVYGYSLDFARAGGAAVIDILAEELKTRVCCTAGVHCCDTCVRLRREVDSLRQLAQQVRDVPVLKVV